MRKRQYPPRQWLKPEKATRYLYRQRFSILKMLLSRLYPQRLWRCSLLAAFVAATIPGGLRGQTAFHLSTDNGLSNKLLTVIMRDRANNMWFGSYNGLFRHEGARIRCYNRVGSDSLSISSGEMHAVYEDRSGNIWIGTTGGLDCLHPQTGIIRHYPHYSDNGRYAALGYIYTIFEDGEGAIWISSGAGYFKVNPRSGVFTSMLNEGDAPGFPRSNAQYHCAQLTDTGFWLGTSQGVVYYQYAIGKAFYHGHNPACDPVFDINSGENCNSSDLCRDAANNLWLVARRHLLARYNTATHRLDTFAFRPPADAWECCYSLAADYRGNIWIGTRHGGLMLFDTASKAFTYLRAEDAQQPLIRSNYIYSLCEDYRHKMWVTTDEGVDIIDYYDKGITQRRLSNEPDFTKRRHAAGVLAYDSVKDAVYVPFPKSALLFRYDAQSGNVTALAGRDYRAIMRPSDGGRTMLSFYPTLSRAQAPGSPSVQNEERSFREVVAAWPSYMVWPTAINSTYYFRNEYGKLFRRDKESLQTIAPEGFRNAACRSADGRSFYFIDGNNNLARQDIAGGGIVRFGLQEQAGALGFSFSNPRDLADDGLGNIWIAAQNGLLQYRPQNGGLCAFTTAQGLSHNFTYALQVDGDKRLWVASLGGIDWYDSRSSRFHAAFSNPDGNYMDAFGGSVRLKDGSVVFLVGSGIVHITPGEYFSSPKTAPSLQWSEALLDEQPLLYGADNTLPAISYGNHRLVIRFSLLEFEQPQAVKYAYRLAGLDSAWISTDNRAEAQLSNLPAGNYSLSVRATTPDGATIQLNTPLRFTVKPAFWQTGFFRASVLALAALLVWLLFRRRLNAVRKKAGISSRIAELEARAIRAQMNPHFIFNSLNAIQELIVLQSTDAAYEYLSKFSRLLRMVLHHSAHNTIALRDEIAMNELYLELESLRFRASFRYTFTVADGIDADATMIPSFMLQPFIENAIWHGLLRKKGDKALRIQFAEEAENLVCTITDNGIGRAAAAAIKARQMSGDAFDSKGMQLSRERLSWLNKLRGSGSGIVVKDLADGEGRPAGTEIRITLFLPKQKG